jgi:hypothetical protein
MTEDEPKEFSKSELNIIIEKIASSITLHYHEEMRIKDFQIRVLERCLSEATAPKTRGRPKTRLSFSKKLLSSLGEGRPTRGRPKKHKNPVEDISLWENYRKQHENRLGKAYITDKETIEIIIQEVFPDISNWKKRSKEAELKKHIKSLRNLTNIRSRTRTKVN